MTLTELETAAKAKGFTRVYIAYERKDQLCIERGDEWVAFYQFRAEGDAEHEHRMTEHQALAAAEQFVKGWPY